MVNIGPGQAASLFNLSTIGMIRTEYGEYGSLKVFLCNLFRLGIRYPGDYHAQLTRPEAQAFPLGNDGEISDHAHFISG